MEFDITYIDKKQLIQTLFTHSAPVGAGRGEYDWRKEGGDNVDGLSDKECELLLEEFSHLDEGNLSILDYHKGKPMKLIFSKKRNGRVLVEGDHYDLRNGKYRFLEAMLDLFSLDEILLTRKGYRRYSLLGLPEHLIRPKEQEVLFKYILKSTFSAENKYGKYWAIDESKVSYTPHFMR